MIRLRNFIPAAFVMLAFSCNTNKSVSGENRDISSEKMEEAGFQKVELVVSDTEGDCPYTLQIKGQETLLDPINLEDTYKKSGISLWVKYRPLRMPNRCEKANPVEIMEIVSGN